MLLGQYLFGLLQQTFRTYRGGLCLGQFLAQVLIFLFQLPVIRGAVEEIADRLERGMDRRLDRVGNVARTSALY